MNISTAVRTAKTIITANSPVLLVGTAIAGVVTTGVLAAKGGYKARGIIDEEKGRRALARLEGEELATFTDYKNVYEAASEFTTQEKIQLTWLCYAVPALTGAGTIASTLGVHTIHTKRHAALAGLYAVTSTKLDDYSDKAEELLGTKKTQALNDAMAQKSVDGNPIENSEVIITGKGTELCEDSWSGRYFESSISQIENAINEINRQLIEEGSASLNEYYDLIGLPPVPAGENFGWSGQKITSKFGSAVASNGRPAISVWFHEEPKESLGYHR